jgi:hypothetical protein
MRLVWTAADGVHRKKNAPIAWVVFIPPIALAASAHQISVKVSITTCSAKYLRLCIVVPTCNDGVENANETGIDCGGWCAPQKKCADSVGCLYSSDCISGVCTSNICQGKYSYL